MLVLPRLSRARIPLRRCLQTQASRPSSASKYAFLAGSFAAVVGLGYVVSKPVALDSPPSPRITLPPSERASASLFKQAEPQSEKPVHASNARHDEPELESVPSGGPSESQSEEEVAKTDEDGEPPASEGAYNPETGEINWDCPCLGGMADGPCGPEFREAFSCFIYSEDEPKGINCVEKFQGMQTCFREHPEVYASEIADDEEAAAAEEAATPGSGDANKDLESDADVPNSESTPTVPPPSESSSTHDAQKNPGNNPVAPPSSTASSSSEPPKTRASEFTEEPR